jgi:hypothetical protein
MHSFWLKAHPTVRPMLIHYFCPEAPETLATFLAQNASRVTVVREGLPGPLPVSAPAPPPPPKSPAQTFVDKLPVLPCNEENLVGSILKAIDRLHEIIGHYTQVNGSAKSLDASLQLPEAVRAQADYLYELGRKFIEVQKGTE